MTTCATIMAARAPGISRGLVVIKVRVGVRGLLLTAEPRERGGDGPARVRWPDGDLGKGVFVDLTARSAGTGLWPP